MLCIWTWARITQKHTNAHWVSIGDTIWNEESGQWEIGEGESESYTWWPITCDTRSYTSQSWYHLSLESSESMQFESFHQGSQIILGLFKFRTIQYITQTSPMQVGYSILNNVTHMPPGLFVIRIGHSICWAYLVPYSFWFFPHYGESRNSHWLVKKNISQEKVD